MEHTCSLGVPNKMETEFTSLHLLLENTQLCKRQQKQICRSKFADRPLGPLTRVSPPVSYPSFLAYSQICETSPSCELTP